MSSELVFSVSDFVAVFNQTLEYAYPVVTVQGELTNFRVSKGRWVYFDLKDELASVKFFGTVYNLPGPLEDGLMVQVSGTPRLHPLYGFSITIQQIRPVGEGSLRRAAALLETKLCTEGLFDQGRKRPLPYPPRRVGLITSGQSAAYHDFIKIMGQRWGGLEIELADVQVQGALAPEQLVAALEYFNTHEIPVDVLVMTRGGGSAEDLAAFNTEQVTRAVAASRIPTLVAIGHEVDISLAELAADQRASTPSNAAELLVPDKRHILQQLQTIPAHLAASLDQMLTGQQDALQQQVMQMDELLRAKLLAAQERVQNRQQLLQALGPQFILNRGYAIVRKQGRAVRSTSEVAPGDTLDVQLSNGTLQVEAR
jgi:exodeoxyribonuclease VII large subunit